jgi:hypothetical protein
VGFPSGAKETSSDSAEGGLMSVETIVLICLGFMGAVGVWQLNCIRDDLKLFVSHLTDRKLHTQCGKEHE